MAEPHSFIAWPARIFVTAPDGTRVEIPVTVIGETLASFLVRLEADSPHGQRRNAIRLVKKALVVPYDGEIDCHVAASTTPGATRG